MMSAPSFGKALLVAAPCLALAVLWSLRGQPEPAPSEAGAATVVQVSPPPGQVLENLLKDIKGGTGTDALLVQGVSVVRRRGEDADAWCQLGDVIAQKQRETEDAVWYAHAEAAYALAHRHSPRHVEALNGLAWVWGGRHDFSQSVRWAREALALDPQNPTAHGIIGDAALELGDLDRAFESYQEMMDVRPDLSSYSRAAWLLWITGDARKARWLMTKAIAAGGAHAENTAWCRARLAHMNFHEGALLPALQTTGEGLKLCPGHRALLLMHGRILAALQRDAEAVAAFEGILSTGEHHDALVALGDLHQFHGRSADAAVCYERIERLHERQRAAGGHDHTQMARYYADHDLHPDRALQLAAEHRDSGNVLEMDTFAWVCLKAGRLDDARRAIRRALAIGMREASLHYHAGLIARAAGDLPEARSQLSRALSLNPRFDPLQAPQAVRVLKELGGAGVAASP